MKLEEISGQGSDEVVTTKIVTPGDWPARTGMVIPGSVLPWATSDSKIWSQSKYTRDVMDDSLQMMQYLVYIPKHDVGQIQQSESREWVVNILCRYELVNIVNRPWDIGDEQPLPRDLALIVRAFPNTGTSLNWVVSLEHNIEDQVRQLVSWDTDDLEDLLISRNEVSYYSDNIGEKVRHSIESFPFS